MFHIFATLQRLTDFLVVANYVYKTAILHSRCVSIRFGVFGQNHHHIYRDGGQLSPRTYLMHWPRRRRIIITATIIRLLMFCDRFLEDLIWVDILCSVWMCARLCTIQTIYFIYAVDIENIIQHFHHRHLYGLYLCAARSFARPSVARIWPRHLVLNG